MIVVIVVIVVNVAIVVIVAIVVNRAAITLLMASLQSVHQGWLYLLHTETKSVRRCFLDLSSRLQVSSYSYSLVIVVVITTY